MTRSEPKIKENSERASLNVGTSTSLNEEVILQRLFPVNQSGFYVDVGGGHRRFRDNTFFLHQRGWRGINIEPDYALHAALTEERPHDINLQTVLSDCSRETFTLQELNGSNLSFCEPKEATTFQPVGSPLREVPVTTLSNILTEVGIDHIHLLKVDVEGFEEKVLNGNDWEKFRPDVVVVEVNCPDHSALDSTGVRSCMDQRGYRHLYFDGVNDFYLEREFAVPENWSLPQKVIDYPVPQVITDQIGLETQKPDIDAIAPEDPGLSLETQLESLQSDFKAAEEYALSLQTRVELVQTSSTITEEYALSLETEVESLRTISRTAEEYTELLQRTGEALAAENRRLAHQITHWTSENRRLREGAEQMRAELLALNKLVEPLYAMVERTERQGRSDEPKLAGLSYEQLNDPQYLEQKVAILNAEIIAAKARLVSVCSSRCWRLTAPLRWCDELLRSAITRLGNASQR